MKKNKNGFTLTELLVTLVIMSILTIIIIPIITNIRDEMLEKSYESKKNNIYSAAKDWAHDNLHLIKTDQSCTYVLVDELIKKAYITGDSENKSVIKNPITGEAMNNKILCIKPKSKSVNNKTVLIYNVEFENENQ